MMVLITGLVIVLAVFGLILWYNYRKIREETVDG